MQAAAEIVPNEHNRVESRNGQARILTSERAETSATRQRNNPFAPRYVNAPTAGKSLLGGDVGLERDVSWYQKILKFVASRQKEDDDAKRGKFSAAVFCVLSFLRKIWQQKTSLDTRAMKRGSLSRFQSWMSAY